MVAIYLGMGYAATKRKERGRKEKRGTFGANSSGKLHIFKNSLSSSSDSLKRVLESVGARAALSLPNSVKNNCGFEVLAITILVLPAKLRAGRRLQDVASALAAADGHKALDESESRMLHELALQVEDDLAALRELVAVATGAVMSAQLDAASSLETYAIDTATPAGRALAMLGDASSANGARFTRLLRVRGGGDVGGHRMVASPKRSTQESAMDPNEGDYVRFKHKRVETTGTVLKRSGKHIRVQPKDGGATLWKELSELLPQQNEASEVAELKRLFSSGPSSARARMR